MSEFEYGKPVRLPKLGVGLIPEKYSRVQACAPLRKNNQSMKTSIAGDEASMRRRDAGLQYIYQYVFAYVQGL
jgi:hypothetical protein